MRSSYFDSLVLLCLLDCFLQAASHQAAFAQCSSEGARAVETQAALLQWHTSEGSATIENPGPLLLHCELLNKENCKSGAHERASKSLCSWHPELNRCQAKIAWFHVMKCGSTFGATLAHFSNRSLPENAHMPSCGYIDDSEEDACPSKWLQGPASFFMEKYPKSEWFPDVFWEGNSEDLNRDPGQHHYISDDSFYQWKGSFVGMFRQPESRLVSSFNHFCGGNGSVVEYATFVQGSVTKMLSGSRGAAPVECEFHYDDEYRDGEVCAASKICRRCMPSAEADLPLALERLKGFAFVGLMEEYDLSVCLFHAMYGGGCLPSEFVNMRKGVPNSDPSQLREQLLGHEDPYDGAVYATVRSMFWDNVETFGVNRAYCAKICPEVEAFKVEM